MNNYIHYNLKPDRPGYLRRLRYLCWFLAGLAVAQLPEAIPQLIQLFTR